MTTLLDLTPQQRRVLLDCTGLSRSNSPYRNAFLVSEGGSDEALAIWLTQMGLMHLVPNYPYPKRRLYQVTPEGLEMAKAVAAKTGGAA